MPDVLTVEQAAEYLQLNPETVRRAARRGRIPAARIGRRWRFRKTALDRWLAAGGSDYERQVDEGLAAVTRERMATAREEDLIDWEEAKASLGR